MSQRRAVVTLFGLALAAAPALAGWGLHRSKDAMTDKEEWTVESEGLPVRCPGGQPDVAGIIVTLSCDPQAPAFVAHHQHNFPGKTLIIRGQGEAVDLGEHGRTVTHAEFVRAFLRGGTVKAEVWTWPNGGPMLQEVKLQDFAANWRKGLKKLGCWKDADWPEVQF